MNQAVHIPSIFKDIFKQGSKTYYYSSLFFPQPIRDDVFILYSFVRTADNFVDQVPQNLQGFYDFRQEFIHAWKTNHSQNEIIARFVTLAKQHNFEYAWILAFLDAMESDIHNQGYNTLADVESYMYGSAEVVGLMMARILALPAHADHGARLLGRAMQYINFIRDIEEDNGLGRCYFAREDLRLYGLTNLQRDTIQTHPEQFFLFVQQQLDRYTMWQEEAEGYISEIPKRYRIPIQTASSLYRFTADTIRKQPELVYDHKIKPSLPRILITLMKNSL